jgi:hypothetical protein
MPPRADSTVARSSSPAWKISQADPSQARAMLTRAAELANDMQSNGILAARDAWMPGELARRIAVL